MNSNVLVETQEKKSEVLVKQAATLTAIENEMDYLVGRKILGDVKTARLDWKKLMDPIREQQHKAWKITCDTIKKIDAPMEAVEQKLSALLGAYESVLEAKRRAEQEARLALAKKQTEDVILEQAAELAKNGQLQEADELLKEAEIIPAAPAEPVASLNDGIGKRLVWSAELVDLNELIKAAAAGLVPASYLLPNMPALNQRARGDKNEMRVPGVRAVSKIQYARSGQ